MLALAAPAVALTTPAPAGPAAPGPEPVPASGPAPSAYDRVWDAPTLYDNPENPFIQEFALVGRLQADAAFFDSGDDRYERLVWRRVRFGGKASLFEDFTLHAEADLDLNNFDPDDLDDAYNRLTETYVSWSRDNAFTLKLGKQSAGFTLDGSISSKSLITPERSQVATNLWFPTEYFLGASAAGEIGRWSYRAGAFSASGHEEFDAFDSGYFGLVSLAYDFGEVCGCDSALARVDYVYNGADFSSDDVGTRDLRHVVSFVGQFGRGRAGLWTDLSFGSGTNGQGDLFGLQVMPYVDLTEKWQGVLRYALVNGTGDGSVRVNRYEDRLTDDRFGEAHEFFAGLNWYLYGHKLKWQNGVEYTYAPSSGDTPGYDGWGLISGLRVSW